MVVKVDATGLRQMTRNDNLFYTSMAERIQVQVPRRYIGKAAIYLAPIPARQDKSLHSKMTRTSHRPHPTPAFPVYCLDWADDEIVIMGGGGGAGRSGIKNQLVSW